MKKEKEQNLSELLGLSTRVYISNGKNRMGREKEWERKKKTYLKK